MDLKVTLRTLVTAAALAVSATAAAQSTFRISQVFSNLDGSMIARGWLPEGYGPLGVVMCV